MTLNRLCILIGSVIAAILPGAAQTDRNYVLAGTVVNARTGEPIPRALVELMSFTALGSGQRAASTRPAPASTFTDATGAFQFSGLAGGNYRLSTRKPQFTEVTDNSREQSMITLDKSREDVHLRLSPLGAIEGKVVDQDGEPVRGVNIVAVTRAVQDGRRLSRFSRSVSTDDRGIYRMWNLAPGKYYIKAAEPIQQHLRACGQPRHNDQSDRRLRTEIPGRRAQHRDRGTGQYRTRGRSPGRLKNHDGARL